jgi:hypothetical protein
MKVKLSQFFKIQSFSVKKPLFRINEGELQIIRSEINRVLIEINENVKLYKLNNCKFNYKLSDLKLFDRILKYVKYREMNNSHLLTASDILEFCCMSSYDLTDAKC